jgi:ABC-type sugar transport system substrate-binding protein
MRKTAVAVLGLVLAAPAFFLACKREHKTTIAVIPKGNTTIFWQSVHAGAAKAAIENGVEIIWNGPPSETDLHRPAPDYRCDAQPPCRRNRVGAD